MHNLKQISSTHEIDKMLAVESEADGFKIDTHIPYLLGRTSNIIKSAGFEVYQKVIHRYAPLNLREFRVLLLLPDYVSMSPKDAAELTGMDRATITRAIIGLKQHGLVKTEKNANDGRSKHIYLTDHGQELCANLRPVMKQFGEHITRNLSSKAIKQLIDILKNVENQAQTWSGAFRE
jgi:DNA-binding MarR family transcriptional regulator